MLPRLVWGSVTIASLLHFVHASRGVDYCIDADFAFLSVTWILHCPGLRGGSIGIDCSTNPAWALSCPISCGTCDDPISGWPEPNCTAEDKREYRRPLQATMRALGFCPGCDIDAIDFENEPVIHKVKDPDEFVYGLPSAGYTINSTKDPCFHTGIQCDRCGQATSMVMGYPGLVPWKGWVVPDFFELTKISVAYFQFEDATPAEAPDLPVDGWRNLTKLAATYIQGAVAGHFPPFKDLQELTTFRFIKTRLYGDINNVIGGPAVQQLSLVDANADPSNITERICDMSIIQSIDLPNCNFHGTLPPCLANLDRLDVFQINNNYLTGNVDAVLSGTRASRHRMYQVRVDNNLFSGTLPETLSQLTMMSNLYVNNNRFTGTFPDLTNLTDLGVLYAQHNMFTSALSTPVSGDDATVDISEINFADNWLTQLPSAWYDLDGVQNLDLSRNNITAWPPAGVYIRGMIRADGATSACGYPPFDRYFEWPSMQVLRLGGNPMHGEDVRIVLGSLAYLSRLQYLDVSNCGLIGDLPETAGGMLALIDRESRCAVDNTPPFRALTNLIIPGNQITGFYGRQWQLISQLDMQDNNMSFIHEAWYEELTPWVQDFRANPHLRLPVNTVAPCSTEVPGTLQGDPAQYSTSNSPFPEFSECTTLCTQNRLIYVDSSANYTILCRCSAGWYGSGLDCTMSGVNEWSAVGSLVPNKCPANSSTEGSSGSTVLDDCVCDPGFYRIYTATGIECALCPENTIRPAGVAACSACPEGQFSLPGDTSCERCPVGSVAASGAGSGCLSCPPGTFAARQGLDSCSNCPLAQYQNDTGSTACHNCQGTGVTTWQLTKTIAGDFLETEGATSEAFCGCARGRLLQHGVCEQCGSGALEGLECPGGLSNDAVTMERGYYATGFPISVYRCWGDEARCAGGPPGLMCADGREGLLCTLCEAAKMPASEGRCVECSPAAKAIAPLVGIACLIACAGFYTTLHKQGKAQAIMGDTVLVMISIMALLLATLQQVGVVSMISVEWDEPLITLLEGLRLLTFDIEVLRLGCAVPVDPLGLFVGRLCVIFVGIAAVILVHCFIVLVFLKGNFKKNKSTLVAAVGGLSTVFYISVVTTMTGPLQCQEHPNGKWTVRNYQSIQCWDDDETHFIMVFLSAISLAIPLGLLGWVIHVAYMFPNKVRLGDQVFLTTYRFLFMRFQPNSYYYIPIPMIRSMLLAITVVIPLPLMSIFAVQVILLGSATITCRILPWKSKRVNYVDMLFHMSMVVFLSAALVYVPDVTKSSRTSLAWVCVFYLLLMLSVVPLVILWTVYQRLMPKAKFFDFFLCHHKVGAGAFTRLLKIFLIRAKPSRQVFVDSDNLENLHELFNHVGDQTDTLVAIASRELLWRPWCVGELTITRLRGLKIVPIRLSDFTEFDSKTIDDFQKNCDISPLLEYGISLLMTQETLRWFNTLNYIDLQADVSDQAMGMLCKTVELKKLPNTIKMPFMKDRGVAPQDGAACIVPDVHNSEAVASALVLEKLMVPIMAKVPGTSLPFGLDANGSIPDSTVKFIFMLSSGCLESHVFLHRLASLTKKRLDISVPVVVQESFRFPSRDALSRAAELSGHHDVFLSFATNLFMEIAVVFDAQMAGETVLSLAAEKIVDRIARKRFGPAPSSKEGAINTKDGKGSSDSLQEQKEPQEEIDNSAETDIPAEGEGGSVAKNFVLSMDHPAAGISSSSEENDILVEGDWDCLQI